MRKFLIVVDMQQDFTYGALRNEEAVKIIPNVVEKVKNFDGAVWFTMDTHQKNYLETQEGKNLPVEHCIINTDGWKIIDELLDVKTEDMKVFQKLTFGSVDLAAALKAENEKEQIDEIELVGVCTDICVISNALLIKANLPEVKLAVDSSCCAGVTAESHNTALNAMKACQIEVK
jgi:nicotinamidase-related amidase